MASASAALLLKATTLLAVVLAMLVVLPSSAPPAPAPAVRCSDCAAGCPSAVAEGCRKYCDPPPACKASRSAAFQGCGTCDYCGGTCGGVVETRCAGACDVDDAPCRGCRAREEEHCDAYCTRNCVQ